MIGAVVNADDLTRPCEACDAPAGTECEPWCTGPVPCIADDSTECGCARCAGDQARWESWQGWNL